VRFRALPVVVFAFLFVVACGYSDPYASNQPIANESPIHGSPTPGVDDFHAGDNLPAITFPDGLQVIDLKLGTGAIAHTGDAITVMYTGWLMDGTLFDSSRGRNQPFALTLGQGQVIPGWEEGVPGMAVGGKRKLIIPSALAYGVSGQTDPNTGATVIPPNANLVFEIELLTVKPGPSPSPSPSPKPSPSPSPSPSVKPT
jgi:FKBP-type peptidyl-prolyl cis-trans isomerase FkpA